MNAPRLVAVVGCLLLDATLAYAGARSQARALASTNPQNLIEVRRGLLTVRVEGLPLQSVLDVIARQSGVRIRVDATTAEILSADLHDVPLDEGLTRILGTRGGAVFVYAGDASGTDSPRLVEVHVYSNPVLAPPDSASRALPRAPAAAPRPAASPSKNVEASSGADNAVPGAWRLAEDRPVPASLPEARKEIENEREIGLLRQTLAQEQDASARARAAKALGRIGGDAAVAPLAASIAADPDSVVREAAASALGKTWTESAVTPLAQAVLEDQRSFVREAAARALGESWSEAAVDALARALSADPRRSVREDAAEALGKIGSPVAVEALIAALGDAHSWVRERAASALGAIGSREGLSALVRTSLTDRDPWVRQSAEGAAAKILVAD